jgi:hypothetical protein
VVLTTPRSFNIAAIFLSFSLFFAAMISSHPLRVYLVIMATNLSHFFYLLLDYKSVSKSKPDSSSLILFNLVVTVKKTSSVGLTLASMRCPAYAFPSESATTI